MDYDAVLRLWADPFTADLADRQVEALRLVAIQNVSGYRICDFPVIREIIGVAFSSLEKHGDAFVTPLCELISLFGLPYRRVKAREEFMHQAYILDLLRVIVAILVWDEPRIQISAATSLESFLRAEGFDDGGSEANSCWTLHQKLLLEADGPGRLAMALRHHLALFVEASLAHAGLASSLLGEGTEAEEAALQYTMTNTAQTGPDPVPTRKPARQAEFARTYAVRMAAVKPAPELLVCIARMVRDASHVRETCLALTRLGIADVMMDITNHFAENTRETLLHTAVETLWNLLDYSLSNFAAASVAGDPAHAALDLDALLDKHRASNTVRTLGTPQHVLGLGRLLEAAVAHGRTTADKEFRNDVLVVLSLVARKAENRPLFALTGVLHMILGFCTAPEMTKGQMPQGPGSVEDPFAAQPVVDVEIPLDRYVTSAPVDVEFKQLCWSLVCLLALGPFADHEARPHGGEGQTEETTEPRGSCLSIIRSSPFIPSLLMHIDPLLAVPFQAESIMGTDGAGTVSLRTGATIKKAASKVTAADIHPFLASLPPPARRALEIQALDILTSLGRVYPREILSCGVLEMVTTYVRVYTDVLNGAAALDPVPHDPLKPLPPSPTKLSHRQSKVLREMGRTGAGMGSSGTSMGFGFGMTQPGSPRPAQLPFQGKHDPGRQYGALRLLHALLDEGVRRDPRAHLSAMISAGVPTMVAESSSAGGVDRLGDGLPAATGTRDEDGVAIGARVAVRLGELGLCEDLITVLKAMPHGGLDPTTEGTVTVPPAETLTFNAFGRTWAGLSGGAALGQSKAVGSGGGHGRGVFTVTEGAFLAEGRTVIRVPQIKEEVLACLAALTRIAADTACLRLAKHMHEMLEADAITAAQAQLPSPAGDVAVTVHPSPSQLMEYARSGEPNSVDRAGTVHLQHLRLEAAESSDQQQAALLSSVLENQDRVRRVGGISALIRLLIECTENCKNRAGGEWGTNGLQPRVATVAVYALRCCVTGNVRSEARFLADGGVDKLLDMVEVAPASLMPVLLTTLADLCRNPVSHVCARAWRSDSTGVSAGVLLLDLWRREEERLGVVHDGRTGAVANTLRPLDGADARARQVAMFNATHKATAAAVRRIQPGGRQQLSEGAPGCTLRASGARSVSPLSRQGQEQQADGAPPASADTVAFRGLRRALRAAKLWQQVEIHAPGGPMSQLVARIDTRHKLYACLAALGFDEVDEELSAKENAQFRETAVRGSLARGGEGDVESKKWADEVDGEEEEDAGLPAVSPRAPPLNGVGPMHSQYSSETVASSALGDDLPATQFPDMRVRDRVTMELAKAYAEFIRGAAWDDVTTRLMEANAQPLPEDEQLIEAHRAAVRETAERVRSMQLLYAAKDDATTQSSEQRAARAVLDLKRHEAEALLFAEKSKHKAGVSQGRAFAGLSMEEKKAGWMQRAQMLNRSYTGYSLQPNEAEEGNGQATTDALTWAQLQALQEGGIAVTVSKGSGSH